ncbi:YraN family protein [uncultured Litoreibacter sp.]|uniref:YraN family protein n=1 Tax=uncultured Litoreibacter sp. TaxID=1392394 RepID=UPI002624E4F7|nr:YraN family protein [uncultured Litoreibacter sp.]
MTGSVSYHSGLSAEETVARHYSERGFRVAAQRFRTKSGEVDLIVQKDDTFVFVEVKKSRNVARAAERVSQRQLARIFETASEFLASQPNGQETDCRIDIGLVDGSGRVEIIENVLAA